MINLGRAVGNSTGSLSIWDYLGGKTKGEARNGGELASWGCEKFRTKEGPKKKISGGTILKKNMGNAEQNQSSTGLLYAAGKGKEEDSKGFPLPKTEREKKEEEVKLSYQTQVSQGK